jgi:energy-coupling factor transporter ATP-binding protein EcfA2
VRSVRSDSLGMFAIDPDGAEEKRAISNEYAEHLIELAPNAVEIRGHGDRKHYWTVTAADGATHTFACIARFDHHSMEAMRDPDAVTYVKLSRRDITCVRDAMLFHATRVRFAEDLPASSSPRLMGMRLRGGGLLRGATIAFNENLNCLIGPRGCGKSTIIEALRYVLGQKPLLEDPDARGGDDRSYARCSLRLWRTAAGGGRHQTLAGIPTENQGALQRWAEQRWAEHAGAYERLNTPEIRSLFGDLDHACAQIVVLQGGSSAGGPRAGGGLQTPRLIEASAGAEARKTLSDARRGPSFFPGAGSGVGDDCQRATTPASKPTTVRRFRSPRSASTRKCCTNRPTPPWARPLLRSLHVAMSAGCGASLPTQGSGQAYETCWDRRKRSQQVGNQCVRADD